MQLPDGLVGGVVVLMLGWIAAGTRWLVKIGARVKALEDSKEKDEEDHEKLFEKMDVVVEQMDDLEKTTGQVSVDVKAIMRHLKVKKGLVDEDE